MFKNHIIVTLRNLLRNKLYTFINIFGLALGIACCILMSLFVKHEWSHDHFHKNKDHIYRVLAQKTKPNGNIEYKPLLPYTVVEHLKSDLPNIQFASTFMRARTTIEYENQAFKETIGLVSPDFLNLFSFPLRAGNAQTAFQNKRSSAVISEKMAEKVFGNNTSNYNQIVGQALIINGRDFEITGVVANVPTTSSLKFEALISEEYYNQFGLNWDESGYASVYLQISPNQSPQDLNTPLHAIAQTHLQEQIQNILSGNGITDAKDYTLALQPLLDLYWNTEIRNPYEASGNLDSVYILWGLAGLVLFIACSNFTTLSVSNATKRALEVGLRKVLGANRAQVMKQFWCEALLLSILGLFLGIALAELFLPTFNGLIQRSLTISYFEDAFFVLLLVAIVLAVGFLAGSYPATVLSRFQPISALKGEMRIGGRNRLIRTLIVLQYTASIALIICTGIMLEQQHYMSNQNLGYDHEHTVVVWPDNRELADLYKQELLKNPQILGVTIADRAFTTGSNGTQCQLPDGTRISTRVLGVDPDYITTLNIPLLQGRNFSNAYPTDKNNAVLINERLAKKLKMENPVGQTLPGFDWNDMNPTIIGIVKDFHYDSLHRKIRPLVLQMKQFSWGPFALIRVKPNNMSETVDLLKETWLTVAPNRPFNQWFLDQHLERQYRNEKRWQDVLTYSTLFTIAISCLGLLGLASLAVSRRTKEIGIRKVLGASVPNLLALLSKDFTILLLIANIIAWPIAHYAMKKWLTNFAYHIELGIGIFIFSGLIALTVALFTVCTQTLKAARSNPVDALRYE